MTTLRGPRMLTRLLAIIAAVALVAGACGGDDDDGTSADTTVDDSSTTTTTGGTGGTDNDTTTGSTPTSGGSSSTGGSATTLPGEDIDLFVKAGDVLGVVGVAYDDELNIRVAPGTDQEIVATAEPTADDLVATGRARSLPNSIWYELTVDGTTGWVNSRLVAFIGGTDDATAEYLARNDRPSAETMMDLGEFVAAGFASTDPKSEIVQVVAPTVGDLGEVTYDVIGIGDDAQIGYRLHIFGVEEDSGESFALRTIERTALCGRGLSGEFCV
ncbi:MAG: SH3 domain-containing protein [Acidimicrobiales bacterium]